ncbi:hypothetical protein B1806_08945 [Metallibacterium scheffleri]|uniref:Uncharacterized protein n=1 Tax=Metallibacterium scheffleri TaxID=993689 RepID=A0A4S3KN23_9GAMM|nr:hypothetical protein B1806_08945 [Metallibacterium scheffleri]
MLFATIAAAASNLNLSKSNIYRLTYSSELAGPIQVQAMLAELDQMGPADVAKLKLWLPANFKRFGIAGERIRKIVVLPRGRSMKETGIVLLTQPDDEAAAIAVTVKSSKSNVSD